jgi:hypothetical protein
MSALASCGHNAKSGFVSTVPKAAVSRCSKKAGHSMISLTRISIDSGTSMPSALAVLRLRTN